MSFDLLEKLARIQQGAKRILRCVLAREIVREHQVMIWIR